MFNSLKFLTKSLIVFCLNQTLLSAESIDNFHENLMTVNLVKEEKLKFGDIVGINKKTGKVRPYRIGDYLVGIAPPQKNNNNAMVGTVGTISFNPEQVEIALAQVYTKDGKLIGQLVGKEKVYLNISSNANLEPLLKKIKILRSLLKAEQLQNKLQTKQIIDLQNTVRKLSDRF